MELLIQALSITHWSPDKIDGILNVFSLMKMYDAGADQATYHYLNGKISDAYLRQSASIR